MCNMKRFLSSLLFAALFVGNVSAHYFVIDTHRLNRAYNELLCNPQSLEKQKAFFNVFPGYWEEFYDCMKKGNEAKLSTYNIINNNTSLFLDDNEVYDKNIA